MIIEKNLLSDIDIIWSCLLHGWQHYYPGPASELTVFCLILPLLLVSALLLLVGRQEVHPFLIKGYCQETTSLGVTAEKLANYIYENLN